ncbi:MAG TPA: LamG-like jellyroll fold domain-containing protein, partial [Polyangiaceae bacterium]|nr:LamG-like jellyroll fold domain-containing protein [Polyangiaceae bacterium]
GGSDTVFVVGGEGSVDRFKGVLASVKIIGSALTAGEVQAEYAGTIGDLEATTKHTTAHSPIALWQFEDNLDDIAGNDYHLSLGTGTERYTELAPGLRGALLDGGTILSRVYTAALLNTGNLTIECGFVPGVWTNTEDLVRFGGGTGQANNAAYALRVVGQQHSLSYLAEYGSSTPKTTSTYSVNDGLMVGTLYHLAMRRESQQITFFINGRKIGSTSATLTAPDGGTSGLMRIGYSGSEVVGGITSVKIIGSALTDNEIKTEADAFFSV